VTAPVDLDRMRTRWPGGDAAFADLVTRYSEPHRSYHDLAHIERVLDTIDELGGGQAVSFAGWFHDVIYDPRGSDNEAASADYAAATLQRMGEPGELIEEVSRLIRLTATHQLDQADDRSGAVLLDADLAILGASPARYRRYCEAVRVEYGWLADDEWRTGRTAVLQGFLARPRLFSTDVMKDRLEDKARSNIAAELVELNQR